jgi:hypothetical protein
MIVHSYRELFAFRARRSVNPDRDTIGDFVTSFYGGVRGWCLCCEGGPKRGEGLDNLFGGTA